MKTILLICLLLAGSAAFCQNDKPAPVTPKDNRAHDSFNDGPSSSTFSDDHTPTKWDAVPPALRRKHNVGIGLTAAGVGLIGIGTILIIANPGNVTSTTGPGTARANFGGVAALGLIMDIAGLPMLIVGAVKLGNANRHARNYLNLRNSN